MYYRIIIVFILFASLWSSNSYSQDYSSQDGIREIREVRKQILSDFSIKYSHLSPSKSELKAKAQSKDLPMVFEMDFGRIATLQYFDENDHPVYYTTLNVGAANTTGTTQLQPGGSLGLNLTGKGLFLGIYDQTRPRLNHVEFGGRLSQPDGSTETISNHATHVAGTMIAAGINSSARGMAYEATGLAFNWESDVNKMTENAYIPNVRNNGHLISNHSYGIVLGWYRNAAGTWLWAGNSNISNEEDYRFGFYSSKSQALDNLTFSLPYYTIVWAAGNDRSDAGNGSRPPDGPDDTIGPEGVAKNVITVGAVSKITNYTSPTSVNMSPFSSWGPTDDGRIKPDLVGVGVSVFSSTTSEGGTLDAYASLSGTSMASPNVAGSLALLQQLFRDRNPGRFMWSSSLKAIAIHTAREAGTHNGPDYIYGWGLLNAEAAARHILEENGTSLLMREETLMTGTEYTYEFISDGITPIKATIAWTDPAGTPSPASLNPRDIKLVNDLDLRIFDDLGNEFFPWTLDPARGPAGPAFNNTDNFRDNVEQVLISAPAARRYTLKVTHKGTLRNNAQEFALIFSAGVQEASSQTLYWIGSETGSWESPANWSLTKGGTSANLIPDSGTRVIFDRAGEELNINITGNPNIFSLNTFGDAPINFNLNGGTVSITNGVRLSNTSTIFRNGVFNLNSESNNEQLLSFANSDFENFNIQVNRGVWRFIDIATLDRLAINDATVRFSANNVAVNELLVNQSAIVEGNLSRITFTGGIDVHRDASIPTNIEYRFRGSDVPGVFKYGHVSDLAKLTIQSGILDILESSRVNELQIGNAVVNIRKPRLDIVDINLGSGSIIDFGSNELRLTGNFNSQLSPINSALFRSESKGTFNYPRYRKICLEGLNVVNVDLTGDVVFNLGLASTVTNGENWLQLECSSVLFANFEAKYLCAGGLTEFANLSEGLFEENEWYVNEVKVSENNLFSYTFPSAGRYSVQLIIRGNEQEVSFTQELVIADNPIGQPRIVVNGLQLTSQTPGESYQWYLDGLPLSGSTSRSLQAEEDGLYQVAIISGACNRVSEPIIISAIRKTEPDLSRFGIFIGPNPTSSIIQIVVNNEYMGNVEFQLYDMSGRMAETLSLLKNEPKLTAEMNLSGPNGVYMLLIKIKGDIFTKRLIKN